MVRRIYAEKKQGFDVEAQNLRRELKENLGIHGLKSLRIVNRYDIENLSGQTFRQAKESIFSEPNLDIVTEEFLIRAPSYYSFGIEYKPGQYDQRVDSAVQCIKLLDELAEPQVRYARIILVEGDLSAADKDQIKKYCINPVDSQEAKDKKYKTLSMNLPDPLPVMTVSGFREMSDKEIRDLMERMGLAMSLPDLLFVRDHFQKKEQRDPTVTELRVIDTYWSDHCRHTTFLTSLGNVDFADGAYPALIESEFNEYKRLRKKVYGEREKDMDICLMDMALIGARYLKKQGKLEDLDESEEVNACSIRVKARVAEIPLDLADAKEEDWLVMFKNETHNHPTEIEPFGGAATCLGGAIRDPLSGRAYVYQAMRVTGSGDPRTSVRRTLPGKLTQYQITRGAARGYSSYGNQVGLATGQVDEIYDEGYVAKRMEIGAVVGAAPASYVRRERPVPGDLILIVGGRTGLDGLGGATGSSKSHTEQSVLTAGPEVQKGNPPVERNIQRLFRRRPAATLIKKCNDFGAGGVSVAIGELADSIDVDLDQVPRKYEGLGGTELAISESQERMAVVIAEEDLEAFVRLASSENVEATVVAKVTDSGRFRMTWRGEKILDLPRSFLDTNGVRPQRDVSIEDRDIRPVFEGIGRPGGGDAGSDLTKEDLLAVLGDLNVCIKKGLIEQFDSTIGAGTILMPLGGKYQATPAMGMAAKLPVKNGDTDTATLMSWGFDPGISRVSPFHGAMYAVLNSVTRIAAMGGDVSRVRLSLQEYFEKPGTVPTRWAKPFLALLGALKVQLALEIPAIGGKDSMSGTFKHLDVPPTLVSFAVAVAHAATVLSPELKQSGSRLIWLTIDKDRNGVPDFDQFRMNMSRIRELARRRKILSASDIPRGGIFVAVAKMALGNRIGVCLDGVEDEDLLRPDYGGLLLEIGADEDASALLGGLDYRRIGETTDSDVIEIRQVGALSAVKAADTEQSRILSLKEIAAKLKEPLETVFPTEVRKEDGVETEKGDHSGRGKAVRHRAPPALAFRRRAKGHAPLIDIAKPRVFLPVFPGTNCEGDSEAAFLRAGALVKAVNLLNLTPRSLQEALAHMKTIIDKSQIIMIPGGFSGGDEPEGSAKFITAVFRSPVISEAVTRLLEERGGLILGVCNGFQALIKLGLLPGGRIATQTGDAPTLTYNTIGRHVSTLVRTRVASTLSPWLAAARVGDIYTVPVSHGEGRFVADEETQAALIEGGQIATQYVDESGRPAMDVPDNPNGSVLAVEGITSPDGRIFGKMGHVERIGSHLYKNVPGDYDAGIFRSGVAYFK